MFRTKIDIPSSPWKINIKDKVLSIGSCFAANTGQLLQEHKFDVLTNPFGNVYNPVSLLRLLEQSLGVKSLCKEGFLENQGVLRHYDLHSDISDNSIDLLNKRFVEARDTTFDYLHSGQVLIITFGTASVFEHKSLKRIVTNCHKMPDRDFLRYNLTVDDIFERFQSVYSSMAIKNQNLRCILTLSPVRHLRDSLEGNQVSKSILRIAIDKIVREMDGISYFPSYEIMMDDLRDYRFYGEDLIHPNQTALKYIWELFLKTYCDGEALDFISGWSKITKALSHKPFNPKSDEHRTFIEKTIRQILQYENLVDVRPEIARLESQLK